MLVVSFPRRARLRRSIKQNVPGFFGDRIHLAQLLVRQRIRVVRRQDALDLLMGLRQHTPAAVAQPRRVRGAVPELRRPKRLPRLLRYRRLFEAVAADADGLDPLQRHRLVGDVQAAKLAADHAGDLAVDHQLL